MNSKITIIYSQLPFERALIILEYPSPLLQLDIAYLVLIKRVLFLDCIE